MPQDAMKMTPEEFTEMRAQAAKISQQDFHLGAFLTSLLHHLAHAHGLDAGQEDAKQETVEEDTTAEPGAQEGAPHAN